MKIFSLLVISSVLIVFLCVVGRIPEYSAYENYTVALSLLIFIIVGLFISRHLSKIVTVKADS